MAVSNSRLLRSLAVGATLLAIPVSFTACGSGGKSATSNATDSGASASGNGDLAQFQKRRDQLLKGSFVAPEPLAAKPQPGKRITVIAFGLASAASGSYAKTLRQNAKKVGWKVNVVDGKFDTATYLNGIRSAIAQKVDAIVPYVVDCPDVIAGAQEAAKAGIPIVWVDGYSCKDVDPKSPAYGYSLGKYNLFTPGETGPSYKSLMLATGAAEADMAIMASKGKMNALVFNETDSRVTQDISKGFLAEAKKCKTCKVNEVIPFVGGDFGAKLQAKTQQALLKHPDTNAIMGNYDDPVLNGIAAGVRSAGKTNSVYITGEGGYTAMNTLIGNGGAGTTIGYDVPRDAYSTVDRLNRIFHKDMTLPKTGAGMLAITKNNALPPEGQQWVSPGDYQAVFEKAWGLR